jgi:HAD superfamily hydrolase (TIGR01509 family)
MARIQLVIFDCDGVLVDSEPITNRVFAQLLNEIGVAVTPEQMYERFVGQSMATCCALIGGMLGRPVPDSFVDEYHARTAAALQVQLKSVAGIETALDAIDALGVPFCVASNGTPDKMRITLGITGLQGRFEGRMFSVADVAHGKPAPDLFLLAARRYGIAPSACCVIEDTVTGVTAGVAAGMIVYGYCALMPERRLLAAGAHRTFSDMHALPDRLFALPGAQ